MTEPTHIPGLDRDGHLSELAIDHYLYGRAEGARALVDRHIAECAACRAALEAVRRDDAARPVPLPVLPAKKPRRVPVMLLAGLAMAAVALLVAAPWRAAVVTSPGAEDLRARGSALSFTVLLHDGKAKRTAENGGAVHPGERARFEVSLAEDGYLLVAGLDDEGVAYAGYPQEEAAAAVRMPRSLTPLALPTAIEFDEARGSEHLFAMLCDHPFDFARMTAAMRASLDAGEAVVAPAGCTLRRVDLHKGGP